MRQGRGLGTLSPSVGSKAKKHDSDGVRHSDKKREHINFVNAWHEYLSKNKLPVLIICKFQQNVIQKIDSMSYNQ